MQASQTLRRPANWQDFETLCHKLWSEAWSYPEAKRNGRLGQPQCGVDVYGIPSWDTGYYGIQCKGKDEYNDKQLTSTEIDQEIEKAKNFKPLLKKLYFATTALKDVKTEEYIRERNIEHIEKGLFEVHLYSWEDIVSLIDENKHTHDWYINNQNYKTTQSVKVTFEDNSTEITCTPKYKQKRVVYILSDTKVKDLENKFSNLIPSWARDNRSSIFGRINRSYVGFKIKIHNTGKEPIQDYKLLLSFNGNVQQLNDTDTEDIIAALNPRKRYTTFLSPNDFTAKIIPINPLLVSDDNFLSDSVFVKPAHDETMIIVEWKLLSLNFKQEGKLIINLAPNTKVSRKFINVDHKEEERTEEGEIEDFFESTR